MSNEADQNYGAANIQILEGLEAVRKRPGMYIGSTSERGLHHLVWEIVDNSIDEALAGYCTHIEVEILKDNVISVTDNGRGMPVDIHPKTKKSAVDTIFTVLHAGGKFDGSNYKVSGGLHGVGASVVNALSKWLEVRVHRNGHEYFERFEYGKSCGDLQDLGPIDSKETGSRVVFKADDSIFTETDVYNYETLRQRIQQLAFLNKGLRITLRDRRDDEVVENTYMYEGGVVEYVKYLNENKGKINDTIIYCEQEMNRITVEIAMQYTDSYTKNIYSFTNNIHTGEGGTHEDGFRLALSRVINAYARENKLFKNEESFQQDDTLEGLTAIVSIKHPNPQFEGQTKTKLGNSEVRGITSKIFGEAFERFLLENPQQAKLILEKVTLAAHARLAAKKAREATRRKSPLESFGSSKLADCRSKDASKCELYLVEGDSAGGSAKSGRDSEYQAILPLRGKVLNVEKCRLDKALENKEILSMIQAIGTGIHDDFNITKARYHKIVIMTDADVDGDHICILLLTYFFRFMPELINQGYIYIAKPPLFKLQSGKRVEYAYSDEQKDAYLKEMGERTSIQRYKGLGEMDASQLWETTMDPQTRTLTRVTLDDAIEADKDFAMLMGDEVEPRKNYIKENAQYATLDV